MPSTYGPDAAARREFVETAGDQSITVAQLTEVLRRASLGEDVELVEGDVRQTRPRYLDQRPELRLSLINLDTDVYEPAKAILEHPLPPARPRGRPDPRRPRHVAGRVGRRRRALRGPIAADREVPSSP